MKEKISQLTAKYANQPTTSVTLQMPAELFDHVKKMATLEGIEYQAMISYFVQQGLTDIKPEEKRLKFEEHARKVLEEHGVKSEAIEEALNIKILF